MTHTRNCLPYFILILMLLAATSSTGQKRGSEKIKALKIAHITTELGLTTDEAQQFWPIYNAYFKKKNELRVQEKNMVKTDMQVLGRLTEPEAKKLLHTLKDIRKQGFEAESKLVADLSTIISSKKIVLLVRAEENFKRKLLKQYGDHKRMIDVRRQAIQERRQEKLDEQ